MGGAKCGAYLAEIFIYIHLFLYIIKLNFKFWDLISFVSNSEYMFGGEPYSNDLSVAKK